MSNADRPSSDSADNSRLTTSLVAALLVLVFYVLSIGPASWLVAAGYLPAEPLETLYLPVIWLYANTPLLVPLHWYFELWT